MVPWAQSNQPQNYCINVGLIQKCFPIVLVWNTLMNPFGYYMSLNSHNNQNIYLIYNFKVRSSYSTPIRREELYVGPGQNVEKRSGAVHPNLGKTSFHKWFITLFCVQVIVNIFTFLKLFMTQVSSPFGNKINIFIFEILILSHIYFNSNQCLPTFTTKSTLWLDNMELCS